MNNITKIFLFALIFSAFIAFSKAQTTADPHAGHSHDHSDSECEEEASDATTTWVGAIVSAIVISLLSLVGIFLLLKSTILRSPRVMLFLIAFAVGALLGDAIYHLLPEIAFQALEMHEKMYLGPMTVTLVSIYLFYLAESLLHRYKDSFDKKNGVKGSGSHSGHSHGANLVINKKQEDPTPKSTSPPKDEESKTSENEKTNEENSDNSKGETNSTTEEKNQEPEALTPNKPTDEENPKPKSHEDHHFHSHSQDIFELQTEKHPESLGARLRKVKSSGWVNLIGDLFHNFVDGLGLGVAFSTTFSAGLATSIAVTLHEVPQELGDFAILVNAGFTTPQALLFNFISSCSCILGALIGAGVGSEVNDSSMWILAFVAGSFIYISVFSMMNELRHIEEEAPGWLSSFIIFAGIFLGFLVMFFLGYYGHDIVLCVSSGDAHDHDH